MDYIVKNELYEEVRIRSGLFLKIKKYEFLSYDRFKSEELKGNVSKVDNRLYRLKKDITREEWLKGKVTYPKDTYIMNGMPVKKSSAEDYVYEITSSGGSISGGKREVLRDLSRIIEQME